MRKAVLMEAEVFPIRRTLERFMRQALEAQPAFLVRGSSRRIMSMRFRPANIRVINRRVDRLGRHSRCFPLAREEQRGATSRNSSLTRSAISERKPRPGLVHHSDRGLQYASAEYVKVLHQHQMIPSMSRPANPYDNASCESFIKTLKREKSMRIDITTWGTCV